MPLNLAFIGAMPDQPAAGARARPAAPIPVLDAGLALGPDTLRQRLPTAHALLDSASGRVPRMALRLADGISRAWLRRSAHPYLDEIDAVAAMIGRPGAYFFNVHYEWGCTTGVSAGPGGTARLVRVLDWRTTGLGRHVVAARVEGMVGSWVTLTWPGFTGVLQAMAPGRFSAALNQAPMCDPTGLMPADWAANRFRLWRCPHLTPAHLLRRAFEEAPDYETARRMLMETPLCVPTIYTLAGLRAGDGCIIERRERDARILPGTATAANDWQAEGWGGRPRGQNSAERAAALARACPVAGLDFSWLKPPLLHPCTRLAMVADAAEGRLVAQGHEPEGPATAVLRLAA
jgi:hypothetical protein